MNLGNSPALGDGGAFEPCPEISPPSARQESGQHEVLSQPPKRRKVFLACDPCRKRKKRCDATGKPISSTGLLQFPRPDFEAAARTHPEPIPAEPFTTKKPSKRLRLEVEPIQLDGPGPVPIDLTAQSKGLSASNMPVSRPLAEGRPQISRGPLLRLSCVRSPSTGSLSDMGSVYSTDAMAVISTARLDGSGFYGSSSTVAFVDSVIQTAEQSDQNGVEVNLIQQPDSLSNCRPTKVFRTTNDGTIGLNEGGLVLPGKRLANSLIECFWDVVHPLFPVLHKSSFLEAYDALWVRHTTPANSEGGQEDEDSNSYCMVNIVMALGAQFNKDFSPVQRARASDDFFQRARRLLALDALDASSFAAVQTLVLTGIYLQSTNHAAQCWNVVGLAIRAAQGLGLHLNEGPSSTPTQDWAGADVGRQMRLRVWGCCLTLDRLVSMTLGRPFMIPSHSPITMPALSDEEDDVEYGRDLGIDCVPPYGCFVYSLHLFRILEDILSGLYAGVTAPVRVREHNGTPTNVPDLTKVVELDVRLSDFQRDLPLFLNPSQRFPLTTDSATLQANVLHVRFLHARILLLRPVLLCLMRTEFGRVEDGQTIFRTALLQDMGVQMSKACVATAHEMIEFLHQRLNTVYRSACWYMVYFTLTSTTVLIAAKLCTSLHGASNSSRFEESWTKSQAILEYHRSQSQSATRGQQLLRTLDDRVSSLLTRTTMAPVAANPYSVDVELLNQSGSLVFDASSSPSAVSSHFTVDDVDSQRNAEAHNQRRKLLARGFSQAAINQFEPNLASKIQTLLDQWERLSRTTDKPINVYPWTHWLGFDTVYHLMFDEDPASVKKGKADPIMKYIRAWRPTFIYKEFMPQLELWGPYVPGRVGGYFRDVQTWKEIAMNVVGQVRVNGTKTTFLSNVLSNEDAYLGRPLNDSELAEECMGGMFGGSGTTANTFVYLLWGSLRDPDVVHKLKQELRDAFPDRSAVPDNVTCSNLPYLQAVIKETLRRYPTIIATLPRTAVEDVVIAGHALPKGTIVGTQNYTIHRWASAFPDAEKFDPDRWLSKEDDEERRLAFTPFSVGPRRCIGMNLAEMELNLLTASFFLRFDATIDPSMTDEDMRLYDTFNAGPAGAKLLLHLEAVGPADG
ncbi:hypothetical protein CLAIMM_13449 [Cladophialophora immunda]|nr:hypothetical protein CLAIMM_13449 [Cladophialophora immunda]